MNYDQVVGVRNGHVGDFEIFKTATSMFPKSRPVKFGDESPIYFELYMIYQQLIGQTLISLLGSMGIARSRA